MTLIQQKTVLSVLYAQDTELWGFAWSLCNGSRDSCTTRNFFWIIAYCVS